MSTHVIRTEGLTKSYGSVSAVTGVDLTVQPGEVYGLLGRNGAGKTTLLRMLVGLVRPTSGTGRVLGRRLGDPRLGGRVGALIETAACYPHLSGRDNLRLMARYCGLSDDAVAAALDLVNLGEHADRRFGRLSLGMRQRAGVAAALLGDPDLLLLDEPTNGLDPGGMAAMRNLFVSLREQGRTVLLSSHLLGEVEQICDRIGVIHNGRLLMEGSVSDVRDAVGGASRLTLRTEPVDDAVARLSAVSGVRGIRRLGEQIEVTLDGIDAAEVNRLLVSAGIAVRELRPARRSLEDTFLDLTEAAS